MVTDSYVALAMAHYQARVETLLAGARDDMMDLAVSEPELVFSEETQSWAYTWMHVLVEPGHCPPPGRRWMVYECGG